jgi:ubiquinone/menaquinone biosynthesis C-methylase UbiE
MRENFLMRETPKLDDRETKRLSDAFDLIRKQREQITRLRDRVERLERILDACLGDQDGEWLFRNREERCDPNSPIFSDERGAFHRARYEFACDYVSGKTVVDLACGTGYGTALLAAQGKASSVFGFDVADDALGYAKRKYHSEIIQFRQGRAEQIPLPDQAVDVVVSFETIEHVADHHGAIKEFSRILKPGGLLIISTPNEWPLEIAPFHTRTYNKISFAHLLATSFQIRDLFNQNSGSDFPFNRGQPSGIVSTTPENEHLAECFIAVCTKG